MIFRISDVFGPFWAENDLPEAREVFKRLPRGGTIHSDQVWARGEPWEPRSWPKS